MNNICIYAFKSVYPYENSSVSVFIRLNAYLK